MPYFIDFIMMYNIMYVHEIMKKILLLAYHSFYSSCHNIQLFTSAP